MRKHRKLIFLAIASANFLAAALMTKVLWSFYRSFDDSLGGMSEEHKIELLRVVHYWAIPPLLLLTLLSGAIFGIFSMERKP